MPVNGRKPIPKTQKELSKDATNSSSSFPKDERGNVLSFNDDSVKPISVGIKDIDESVMYYFNNVIKPYVIQNGERLEVPVIYGSPEKWKSFQKDGYYRDSNGKMMMPIIAFKRNNIEKLKSLNKLDANFPVSYDVYGKKYSNKNHYTNFNLLTNQKPIITNYAVVVPDYIVVTYDCIISTYYIEQLNKIIEAVQYASDSYWGDPSRFKFKTIIDSFPITTDLSDNGERVVRSSFSIKLYGYLIPDIIQKDLNSVKKFNTPTKFSILFNESDNLNITSSSI